MIFMTVKSIRKSCEPLLILCLMFSAAACRTVPDGSAGTSAAAAADVNAGPSVPMPKGFRYQSRGRVLVVEAGDPIRLTFTSPPDFHSIDREMIRLTGKEDGEEIPLEWTVSGNQIIIRPLCRFVPRESGRSAVFPETGRYLPHEKGIRYLGMVPDGSYRLVLSGALADLQGRSLADPLELEIRTTDLQYGLYWMGPDGYCARFIPGESNPYYDPDKPVILFSHGWQPGMIHPEYWMQQPWHWFSWGDKPLDLSGPWLEKGYNIGFWNWGQFADEENVWTAEQKIWKTATSGRWNGPPVQGLRYRLRDGGYRFVETGYSIGDMFFRAYTEALADFRGGSVTLAGHSLGNQTVTALAGLLGDAVRKGEISERLLPDRLVLLDPFWGSTHLSHVNGRSPAELCTDIVRELVSDHGLAVEQIMTSGLGGLVTGDENLAMRELSAFYRVWPAFIPMWNQSGRHQYAIEWYFASMSLRLAGMGAAPIGAAAEREDVLRNMNFGMESPRLWYSTGEGSMTPEPEDDYFLMEKGLENSLMTNPAPLPGGG